MLKQKMFLPITFQLFSSSSSDFIHGGCPQNSILKVSVIYVSNIQYTVYINGMQRKHKKHFSLYKRENHSMWI